jgi:TonB-linked SusC/RagA family outer membrane protein
MRKIAKQLQLVLYGLLLPFALWAQTTITGKVTDVNGNPLTGASVVSKSTNSSTQTDGNGAFSIKVSGANPKITISYVGFVSQTVNATDNVSVVLQEDQSQLSEVVVSGLATRVKRSNLANSVASISAKQLNGATRPSTVDAALQGKLPGAQITANGGAPGGGFSMRLRGVSSINLSSEPLYIVDGVYVNNSQFNTGAGTGPFSGATGQTSGTQDQAPNRLADLNPADIESVEVLKGPSAAAIYGTRANAGVVIITTKRGKTGKTSFSFGQDIGMIKALHLTNMHKTIWDQQFVIGTELADGPTLAGLKSSLNPSNQTWDYERIVYGNTGLFRDTRFSASGGTDKIRFYAAGSVRDETGIQKRTGYGRNSVRLNLDIKPAKWWDLGIASNFVNTNSDRSFSGNDNNGVSLGYNLAYLPNWLPQLPVNGVYPDNPLTGQNPLQIVDKATNNEKVNRFITSFSSTITFFKKSNHSLKLQMQGGVDFVNQENFVFMPEELQFQQQRANPGAVRYTYTRSNNKNIQAFLVDNASYKKINFTTSLGAVSLETQNRQQWFQGEGVPRGTTNPINASVQLSNLDIAFWQDFGLVAQEEINWDDKIIVTGGVRFDKTSLNGNSNKYYAFPKASAAINLSSFDFWTIKTINQFKLRAAYGETGNPAAFGSKFTNLGPAAIGGLTGYVTPVSVGNPVINPERSAEVEFGLDFGVLNNRITGEVTYYNRKIYDFIDVFNISPGTGVNSYKAFNVGDIQNKGWEVGLTGRVISNKKVSWNTTVNWWQNRSKVIRLDIPEKATAATGFGAFGTQRLRVGVSPTAWFGTPNVNGLPTVYEDAQPKWQIGWSNNITFLKHFEFSFLLHHSHKNFNSSLNQELTDEGGTSPDWGVKNKDGVVLGWARKLGQPGISTRQFIVDGTFTKLREIALYYTIPNSVFANSFLKALEQVKVGISGQNLFMWTKYYGYDPEAANFGNRPTIAPVDLLAFPSARRMYFHLNVNF